MTLIRASGGRLIAPIDRTLDPTRGLLGAGGYLRAAGGRGRAAALPIVRAGAGDFGPLLHWHADDATADAWPCRTSIDATLTPINAGRAAVSSTWNGANFKSFAFTDGSTVGYQTPDLTPLWNAVKIDVFEVVIVATFTTNAPAAQRRILGTDDDVSTFTSGRVEAALTTGGNVAFSRYPGATDGRQTARVPAGGLRIVHGVVYRPTPTTGAVDVRLNSVGSDTSIGASSAAPTWTGTRLYLGADLGAARSAGMKIREIAFYDRLLTKDERRAIFAGYTNARESIFQYPTIPDLLDLTGAQSMYFDSYSQSLNVAAGIVQSIGGWTRVSGSPAVYPLPAGRRLLYANPDMVLDAQGTITQTSPNPWETAAIFTNGDTVKQTAWGYGTIAGDEIGVSATTNKIRGAYNGATLELVGDSSGLTAMASLSHDGGTGLRLEGALFSTEDPTIALSYTTGNVAARASLGIKPRIGASVGGANPVSPSTFLMAGFAINRLLSAEERRTLLRWAMQERA